MTALLFLVFLGVSGCALVPRDAAFPTHQDVGVVTAVVRVESIESKVASDGGYWVYGSQENGDRVVFGITSLYTKPPPSQQTMEVFGQLSSLAVGEWAEVKGHGSMTRDKNGTILSILPEMVRRIKGSR